MDAVIRNLTVTPGARAGRWSSPARATSCSRAASTRSTATSTSTSCPTACRSCRRRGAGRAFLRFTDRDPDEARGAAARQPAATIWSIAVNGVMAGCRPEYMPVLVALVEAMADPGYGVEHSGNTPGAETLIILNGPIIKELGFNYAQGALRDGFQANTTIGRFWRLYLRNVAGFLPHKTDKATFGNTWRVVLAENEDVLRSIGWRPRVGEGLQPATTRSRSRATPAAAALVGVRQRRPRRCCRISRTPRAHVGWQLMFTVGHGGGHLRPLLLLSPIIAETIARAGWSRRDAQARLFEHARIPAQRSSSALGEWTIRVPGGRSLAGLCRRAQIPEVFAESDDPNRLVPIVWRAGGLHDRRDRRSAAQQRLRLRAQRLPGLSRPRSPSACPRTGARRLRAARAAATASGP